MNNFSLMRFTGLWLSVLLTSVFMSCSMMTDDRSDCPMGLYLKFKYDYNLQRANMFHDHVGAVDVYVFDENGHYVTCQSENNTDIYSPLASTSYLMHMDLKPGKYKFIVLAGQDSYKEQIQRERACFMRSELQPGADMSDLNIRLETKENAGMLVVDNKGLPLDTLWHGMEVEPVEVFAEKPTYHTISLMRDTKKINVTLREIDTPETMDVNNYDMTITDHNTHILWDNSLNEERKVVYTPHYVWNTTDRTPATDHNGDVLEEEGKIAHADFMTSRIMWHDDVDKDGVLSVVNKTTGIEVIRINLPDILSRLRTSEEIYRYSNQEFLDRGYDYKLDFYLKGDRLAYVNISISVLGWSKKIQFEEL